MGVIKVLRLCFAEARCAFTEYYTAFRTVLTSKILRNMPDSIKVILGIGQSRTGNVLFGGHSSNSVSNECSEFRLLKFAKPKCQ